MKERFDLWRLRLCVCGSMDDFQAPALIFILRGFLSISIGI
jgi:hypothetical protein